MRLWHYKLIPVLPRKQLVSQWRECCAVAGEINKHGSPRSPLTKKITNYPLLHFISYTNKILEEMHSRGYKVNKESFQQFVENIDEGKENFFNHDGGLIINREIFPQWHNDRYLRQCYYNLQEKYDCGIITEEEWQKIEGLI